MNALPVVLLSILAPAASACNDIADNSSAVFVSPEWLNTSMGDVTVLDARGAAAYDAGHLPSAARAGWQAFTMGCPGTTCGVLNTPAFMTARFAELGVSPATTVVIYGAWEGGWGDEGRIHWMLKSLGHQSAFILSGGLAAYTAAYDTTLSTTAFTPTPVDVSAWSSGVDTTGFEDIVELMAGIQPTDLLIDTRTQGEYSGALSGSENYNVLRDGHAAGAVLFSFTDFFDGACLKTCEAFEADLTSRGWTSGTALVAYCTAGIRSAFFWSLATHCNIPNVSNYAGSMWEYAAGDLPMTTSQETSGATKILSAGGLLPLVLALVWMRAWR